MNSHRDYTEGLEMVARKSLKELSSLDFVKLREGQFPNHVSFVFSVMVKSHRLSQLPDVVTVEIEGNLYEIPASTVAQHLGLGEVVDGALVSYIVGENGELETDFFPWPED